MYTERVPGFAICARCGVTHGLGACQRCGLLVCKECRGDGECIFCHRELRAAATRAQRNRRLRLVAHRAGVAACIAASALAAVGAAFIPDPPLRHSTQAHAVIVARGQVRFVAESVERYWEAHGATCPSSLGELRLEGYLVSPPVDPWGEVLLYGCIEAPRSFVILSKGPDRLAGTADDVSIATP